MIPLYSTEDFEKSKYLDKLSLQCECCKSTFLLEKKYIIRAIRGQKNNTAQYCSKKCFYENTTVKKDPYNCKNCDKIVFRRKTEVRSLNIFCCHSCNMSYSNKNKTIGIRVSKLEKYLQSKLTELYQYDFHFNRKDTINSELDIYIPELNLAFELNGIFHYEPIYGADKLNQIQNNDNRKFQACIEHGIELCIIDTQSQKQFSEKSSKKYLDIIIDVINLKKGV